MKPNAKKTRQQDSASHDRHLSVLKAGASSFARSIIHAVAIKDEEIFFLSDSDGMVPLEPGHGLELIIMTAVFSTVTS